MLRVSTRGPLTHKLCYNTYPSDQSRFALGYDICLKCVIILQQLRIKSSTRKRSLGIRSIYDVMKQYIMRARGMKMFGVTRNFEIRLLNIYSVSLFVSERIPVLLLEILQWQKLSDTAPK